jgi:Effector Associated Constant Component 1
MFRWGGPKMSGENGGAHITTSLSLVVHVDPEVDPERAERLVRRLRGELTELDVTVSPVAAGPPPEGAKGTDQVTLGALVVAFSASGGVFTTLVGTVRDWLDRQSGRHRVSMTIDGDTIELERASASERQQLLDAFVRRHSGG